MAQQQTLREPVSFAGIGLHSGHRVNLTFLPAPANSGLRFRRLDLEGKPEIEAHIDNVSETNRSTTLARGNVKVHTVEHVLATFAGFSIDNAIIELDSNEPPIGDGSARPFCELIRNAGLLPQPEPRLPIHIQNPIQIAFGDTLMSVFPCDHLKISCTSTDKNARFTQFYSIDLSPEKWERELAPARTFCFFEEIEFLIKNGLIRGGSLENAVVIRDDAVLTTEPLRYPEEFVRHKILDMLGDLALLGQPLCAHIVAIKPSHAANCELARQINLQHRKPLPPFLPTPLANDTTENHSPTSNPPPPPPEPTALDVNQVMKLVPHRYPFLMVDKISRIEGNQITGIKNVTINEPFFAGHFPGHPIMPGVLQLEAIAQVAGVLMFTRLAGTGKVAYFMSAESVKFRKPVLPGDQLVIQVELIKARGKIGRAKGVCTVNGEIVSEGEVTFMLMDAQPV